MARLATSLERAGHRCVVYLHDRHGWAIDRHRARMRAWWPDLRAELRDLAEGIEDCHAIFATAWETAYPALTTPARGVRFYLVQDFEPLFYAAGSEALLAEATYRFGFHGVTAGRWLAGLLSERYGMDAEHFEFGVDLARYRMTNLGERRAVCMYARPSTPRRAFELAAAAMDLFSERHPEIDVHLYGESVRGLPFRAISHGTLSPAELAELYNRCVAGLVLSATNVSLVPHEMLAAGCIPVVNDAAQSRLVLDNPSVLYAPATPFDLANALAGLVERGPDERAALATEAAASVRGASWGEAGATVERIVRRAVEAALRDPDPDPDIAKANERLTLAV
jgi:glycosyltransferase involved in cell wall biosynthesis